jgi:hypothetical protein
MLITSFGCGTAGPALLMSTPEVSGVVRGPEIPVARSRNTMPGHATLLAKNIPSPHFAHR